MNIGEKIRELRVAKLMTQSELAGSHITRNMLSCIENGTAQPSLSTILYIASRLNVPAGFLLAEEGDACVVTLCRPRQGMGGAPLPRAAKNRETEDGSPLLICHSSWRSLDRLLTSLGLEVSFCEMGQRGLAS